ncbi:MAG: radical SAM protein [Desulfuromonadales bacterium]|nr:radical SAM protein [Desulfuromonadales bacterium]
MTIIGKKVSMFRQLGSFIRGRIPGQLIIQLTDHCNASCPQCGMRRSSSFRRSTLSLDDGRKIIDHAAASGVSALSLTGGEPFLLQRELITLIKHAGAAGIPYIRTGTNGFMFMDHNRPGFLGRVAELADALAATTLHNFWISVDSSLAEVHERMRGLPGVIRGIEKALPIFHERGIYPSANLGITRNVCPPRHDSNGLSRPVDGDDYRAGFRNFFARLIDMGFTIANACYPMSIAEVSGESLAAVYEATADDDLVRFTAEETRVILNALRETIPEYRSRIRIFSPLSSLRALERQHSGQGDNCQPCRGGSDFFFIDAASGDTYPCGYRGNDNLGKFWNLDLKKSPLSPSCRQCDWECFRDPSELLGPFADLFSRPVTAICDVLADPAATLLKLSDLRYYLACDLFNGRLAPDFRKLASSAG